MVPVDINGTSGKVAPKERKGFAWEPFVHPSKQAVRVNWTLASKDDWNPPATAENLAIMGEQGPPVRCQLFVDGHLRHDFGEKVFMQRSGSLCSMGACSQQYTPGMYEVGNVCTTLGTSSHCVDMEYKDGSLVVTGCAFPRNTKRTERIAEVKAEQSEKKRKAEEPVVVAPPGGCVVPVDKDEKKSEDTHKGLYDINYTCRVCITQGVKLWRYSCSFDSDLHCGDCAMKTMGPERQAVLYDNGTHEGDPGYGESKIAYEIGAWTPAVRGIDGLYWGMCAQTPRADWLRWEALPLRTFKASAAMMRAGVDAILNPK